MAEELSEDLNAALKDLKQAIYTISFPNSTAAAKYIDAHILSVK